MFELSQRFVEENKKPVVGISTTDALVSRIIQIVVCLEYNHLLKLPKQIDISHTNVSFHRQLRKYSTRWHGLLLLSVRRHIINLSQKAPNQCHPHRYEYHNTSSVTIFIFNVFRDHLLLHRLLTQYSHHLKTEQN